MSAPQYGPLPSSIAAAGQDFAPLYVPTQTDVLRPEEVLGAQ